MNILYIQDMLLCEQYISYCAFNSLKHLATNVLCKYIIEKSHATFHFTQGAETSCGCVCTKRLCVSLLYQRCEL